MKIYLPTLLLLLVCCTCARAQRLPDYGLNRTRITGPDGRSQLIETRPSGNPRTDESKTYYWYSANRVHTTQGGYSGKLLNGPYQQFDGEKNLRERGTFSRGLKSGTWKAWNERGMLMEETSWKGGSRQGAFRSYDGGGRLARAGRYKQDQLSGKVLIYSGPDLVKVIRYKAGRELPGSSGRPSFFRRLWPFGRHDNQKDSAALKIKEITTNTMQGSSGTGRNQAPPVMQPAGVSWNERHSAWKN